MAFFQKTGGLENPFHLTMVGLIGGHQKFEFEVLLCGTPTEATLR